jgi:hypothetical protein
MGSADDCIVSCGARTRERRHGSLIVERPVRRRPLARELDQPAPIADVKLEVELVECRHHEDLVLDELHPRQRFEKLGQRQRGAIDHILARTPDAAPRSRN